MDLISSPIKVVIVDDHPFACDGLVEILGKYKDMQMVGQFTSALTMLDYFSESGDLPDIVLIDYYMPDMDGLETTKKLSELYPTIRKITFSYIDNLDTVYNFKKAGSNCYITKITFTGDLAKIIRSVHHTGSYPHDTFARHERHLKKLDELGFFLTPTEKKYLEILKYGLSQKDLAVAMHVSIPTIERYRTKIMRKLGVTNTIQMVVEAIRRGIIDSGKN